jgi:hypothetical protein
MIVWPESEAVVRNDLHSFNTILIAKSSSHTKINLSRRIGILIVIQYIKDGTDNCSTRGYEMGYLILTFQFGGALLLFFGMNWLGRHATELGYQSIILFEQKSESIALNFLIRAVSPSVFIILISALILIFEVGDYTRYTFGIIIFYYAIRILYIFIYDKQEIVNWIKIVIQILFGLMIGWWAFYALILPKQDIFPDAKNIGNELWVMIALFLYTIVNKIETPSGPSNKRKNRYIKKRYLEFKSKYDKIISTDIDLTIQLITYAILIYENYNRPPLIRSIERMVFPKLSKTLGIMQVSTSYLISDEESVVLGLARIQNAKMIALNNNEKITAYFFVSRILAEYNKDDDYIDDVMNVMRIIARRIDNSYSEVWDNIDNNITVQESR